MREVNKRPEAAKGNRRDRKRHDGGREKGRKGMKSNRGAVRKDSRALC